MGESRLFFRLDRDSNNKDYIVEAWLGEVRKGTYLFPGSRLPANLDLASRDLGDAALDDLGGKLFALVSGRELADVWREARQSQAARVVFEFGTEELAALPWETLRDDQGNRPFGNAQLPASRTSRPYGQEPGVLPIPLRILVVIGDPADQALQADDEVEAIYRGLSKPCCSQVDVLYGPDQEQLRKAFTEIAPHVFHFVGTSTSQNNVPALEIGDWKLTTNFLINALADNRPRLVVLNACHKVEPSITAKLARGLASAFLDTGALAVVGTQGPLAPAARVHFTDQFYSALAEGTPVDLAAAKARSLLQFRNNSSPAEWVLPVLETRVDPSLVLRHAEYPDPHTVLRKLRGFGEVPRMLDRSSDRRKVHSRIENRSSELLFVIGDEQMGKSLMLRSYLISQVLNGQPVIYVSLEHRGNVSVPDFVRTVTEQARLWLDDEAVKLLCEQTEKALDPQRPAVPTLSARPRDAVVAPDLEGYQKLKGLLVNLARPASLVLVLDDVAQIDHSDAFVSALVAPAANGELHGVRLVIAGGRGQWRKLAGPELTEDREVEVRAFHKSDAPLLAREYLTRTKPKDVDAEKWAFYRGRLLDWASGRVRSPNDRLKPGELISSARLQMYEAGLL